MNSFKQFLILTAGGLVLALIVFPLVLFGLKYFMTVVLWMALIVAVCATPVAIARGVFEGGSHTRGTRS